MARMTHHIDKILGDYTAFGGNYSMQRIHPGKQLLERLCTHNPHDRDVHDHADDQAPADSDHDRYFLQTLKSPAEKRADR